LSRSLWFTNIELRYRFLETKLGKQRFAFGLAPFVDAGTVRDRWQDLNFNNIKFSYGAGLQLRGTNLQFYLLIMESQRG
jgi:outer membrane translocation and assembly module TamA